MTNVLTEDHQLNLQVEQNSEAFIELEFEKARLVDDREDGDEGRCLDKQIEIGFKTNDFLSSQEEDSDVQLVVLTTSRDIPGRTALLNFNFTEEIRKEPLLANDLVPEMNARVITYHMPREFKVSPSRTIEVSQPGDRGLNSVGLSTIR